MYIYKKYDLLEFPNLDWHGELTTKFFLIQKLSLSSLVSA